MAKSEMRKTKDYDLNYKGSLDASGGSYPTSPKKGDYYVISVNGTISGKTYKVSDWAVYNGTGWDKIDNQAYQTGALNYRGVLDASEGSYPGSPVKGDYYVISVQGTISGTLYKVLDWAVYNGTSWDKIDNQQVVPTVSNKTDNYNVQVGDFDNVLTMNAATAKTFTLPTLTSSEVGKQITFVKLGAGKVTIQAAASQYIGGSSAAGTIYCDIAIEVYATITLIVVSETKLAIKGFDGTFVET